MNQAAPDDLDALLASLLAAPAPATEPLPVTAPNALPTLTPAAAKVIELFRAWLDTAKPAEIWKPVAEATESVVQTDYLDPETLLELAAARAWRSGDQKAFDQALARLPADDAQQHRRMAAVCELTRMRSEMLARPGMFDA